jgi:metal-responsive CopG/Arc/MetJ family transcriptional regulator
MRRSEVIDDIVEMLIKEAMKQSEKKKAGSGVKVLQ